MDDKTIYNGRDHITSSISMTWLMMDVEDINSDNEREDIEDKDKHQKHSLAEKQQHIIAKHQQKIVQQPQHQKPAERQAQGLAVIGGLVNLHVLYDDYDVGINSTKTENSQSTSLVGGKHI